MAQEYSIDTVKQLEAEFGSLGLHRPMKAGRYEPGAELEYTVAPIQPGPAAKIRARIERFVGGGYAGQVYQIRILDIWADGKAVQQHGGLNKDRPYALKILIPPSGLGRLFRNTLYAIGFGGPFQPQVNPAAARAGAIWQKFIRRAAGARFGDTMCVNDIHAALIDHTLGSCGEISDWVNGRTWRLEVDDHLDRLRRWRKGKPAEPEKLGSPEYRAKYGFMTGFVRLLHEMGAHEFARQYEWTTCKSQPNCLKRLETNTDPAAGLIAVDFRAGLTLLPFLPMSPGDFKLIGQGILRGSWVQFDRGDLKKLERYIEEHPEVFADMPDRDRLLRDLAECEDLYRNCLPDITHNGIRLFYDRWLWSTMFSGAVTGWKTRNLIDDAHENRLRKSRVKIFVFFLIGLIPLLGRVLRKAWGRPEWRAHYMALLSSPAYFGRAVKGKILETLIGWHRKGRLSEKQTAGIARQPIWFFLHLPLAILPAGLHRFVTDAQVFKAKLYFLFVRPFKLYFNAGLREQWLRDMVQEGKKKHILSEEDAETILSRVSEPYIQKYLVSLVVHLMTLPVTQVVSGALAAIFYFTHPEMPEGEKAAAVAGILILFQVIPISPGSFCRGLYTTYMAIHDRNFKDYNIALFLSYFKYVGYLAFPIQMTYRYPELARFMAAHWATDAVHIVPVFGERGALLEHWIFCLFYNWPLTIRRRMKQISEMRLGLAVRLWHVPAAALITAALMVFSHHLYHSNTQILPTKDNLWYLRPLFCLAALIPAAAGWATARFAGGLVRSRRIIAATLCGTAVGLIYTIAAFGLEHRWTAERPDLLVPLIWRVFAFTIFSTIGALIAEITLADPDLKALSDKS
jgi:hypothetical protein